MTVDRWTDQIFIKLQTLLGERGSRSDHAVRFRDLGAIYTEARNVAAGAATLPSNLNEIIANAIGTTVNDAVSTSIAGINADLAAVEQDVADFSTAIIQSNQTVADLTAASNALTQQVDAAFIEIDTAVTTLRAESAAYVATEAAARTYEDEALAGSILDIRSTFSTSTGVLSTAFLDPIVGRWNAQGSMVATDNELHQIGQTRAFSVTSTQSDGLGAATTIAGLWTGQRNADAYVVEVDFTLTSGTLDGAGVYIGWVNTVPQTFAASLRLADMLPAPLLINQPMTARAILRRPTGFIGTFANHTAHVFANWSGLPPMAAKGIKFHRWLIRVATAEEIATGDLGVGLADVVADVAEEIITRANADTALAGQITTLDSNLNSLGSTVSGQATALSGLTTRVSDTESDVVSLASAQTDLSASVSTIQDTMQGFRSTLDAVGKLTAGAAGSVATNAGALGQTATLRVTEGATARTFTGATNGASIQIPAAVAAIFAGQRVKIGVLAYQAASNTATRFGIAYSAGTPGNSGYLNADRDLVATPQWYEFFYTVPFATAAGQAHYIGIFADSTKTGKSTVVAKINIEIAAVAGELPEITTLEAAVTAEQSARANADTALSNSISSVSAVANARNRTFRQGTAPTGPVLGDIWYNTASNNQVTRWSGTSWDDATDTRIATIQSQVTQQSTAIADLEGNASAMYALRVGAGGAGAGFEIVAADSPQTGPASSIRMNADNILLEGTVTAEMMNVTSLSAISANLGTFVSGDPLGERTVISGDRIEVYDQNNILRVLIGDLS